MKLAPPILRAEGSPRGRGDASARTAPRAEPGGSGLASTNLLIADLLDRQQTLTAVDRFAQRHADCHEPLQARYYRDLIPLAAPGEGQQYAFEVDLDRCSGCKACVTACHELNGLDEGETWRSVGLLHGGTSALPVIQHVTSACHHCLDPACLYGCPVNAYEKDAQTGIVRHLDDQCIGCQYCILKCPYDVPKYNKSLGIVRKCDMCGDRLQAGEAPACVQACPTSAIRVGIVDTQTVVEESETDIFLPGAPGPQYTRPTTAYRTQRPLPRNLLPADYYAVTPGHSHPPLVWMLVLTQMSVGAFAADLAADMGGASPALDRVRPIRVVAALLVGLLGLGAAIGHLGRPRYAFRAMIGLRTSWLSREILAFGLFATFAAAYAADIWLGQLGLVADVHGVARWAAAAWGAFGVYCSVMIYVDTRRPFWGFSTTAIKFLLTAVVLGIPSALLVSVVGAACLDARAVRSILTQFGPAACGSLAVAMALKVAAELLVLRHLRDREHTSLKRTALLVTGELRNLFLGRLALGLVGGVLLPASLAMAEGRGAAVAMQGAVLGVSLALVLAGELLERYLFFTAVAVPKMPGSVVS